MKSRIRKPHDPKDQHFKERDRELYKGRDAKVEIILECHNLIKNLPIHERALKAGLRIPKFYGMEHKGILIYKYTEWIKGEVIYKKMAHSPKTIEPICTDLAIYINEMYNIGCMSPGDNNFFNFVWDGKHVTYIDLEELRYEDYKTHIDQMVKLCLNSCRCDKRKIIAFLKEYSKHMDIKPVLEELDRRKWKWPPKLKMDPITLDEIMRG